MILRAASGDEAPALADVHAEAFEDPWDAGALAALMAGRGAFALVAEESGALAAFILCRAVAGEAEVLTLAVRPSQRRRGLARSLLEAAILLGPAEAEAIFLEVAADNAAAIALYRKAGFTLVGRRGGYYAGRPGERVDALVLRRPLNS